MPDSGMGGESEGPQVSQSITRSSAPAGEDVLLRAAVEYAPVAMVMIDASGRIVLVNAETEKLFGYSRDELLDQPVEVLVPERFRPEHPSHRQGFFAKPEARRMGAGRDLFGLRKNGSEFPVEIGLNPVETDEGLFVLSAIVDITERKQLEQRFRATVESAPTAMVMINSSGRIVLVNAETEKLFGYSRDELLDQPVEVLVPERFRPEHPSHRQGFFANPAARRMGAGRDLAGLRKDGSEFPIEIGLNPVETDEGLFVLSAIVDITARKQLEQRFRATVESAPTAMVMINSSGRIVLVNAETEKLFGYSRDELLDQPVEVLVPERFRPEHPSHRQGFFANPAARRMGAGRDLFGLRKNGSEFPIEIGLNPVETDEGLFVLSAIVDNTQRMTLEESQRRANRLLEESNEELKQFAYVASHDLQEPLRKVSSFCQLLDEEYSDQLEGDGKSYLFYIIDGAKRMRALISDLLEFSRIETQGRPLEPTNVSDAFAEAIEILETVIDENDADVSAEPMPIIMADRIQLVRLFQNLIGNALKYRRDEAPKVRISAKEDGHEWIISVKDNGIGMESQYYDRVFVMFQRLHARTEYSGTGIGLAICKRIVDRLHGRIWVESELGTGSTFFISVPKLNTFSK